MMTSQSDGKAIDEETGTLTTTDYKRHRITGGITFSLSKAFRTDLRLNYEKYFYAKNSIAKESEQDKIVLELMVRFLRQWLNHRFGWSSYHSVPERTSC